MPETSLDHWQQRLDPLPQAIVDLPRLAPTTRLGRNHPLRGASTTADGPSFPQGDHLILNPVLKEKAAARYDIDGIPYAVAVGIHDMSADDEEILAGIYGRTSYIGGRENTGLFAATPGTPDGRHRRMSAVFVMRGLPLWEEAVHDVVMLRNPHADQSWPQQILPARLLEP
jgi:hypothetical protein